MPYETYDTVLTDARNSLWNAIDNFPDLSNRFKRKFKFDEAGNILKNPEPAFSELPAIAVVPLGFTPKWFTYELQKWPYSLRIVLWTPEWLLAPAENLIARVWQAVHRSAPEGGAPYTKRNPPTTMHSTNLQMVTINKDTPVQVVRSTIDLVLRCNFTP